MKWTQYVRFLNFEDYCLIVNQINNTRFKISFECLKYIQKAIDDNISRSGLINSFNNQADIDYMVTLLTKLYDLCMLSEEDIMIKCNNVNITWCITNRCNLLCKYCSVSASKEKTDLSVKELLLIAEKISSIEPRAITISGGEPLVNKHFTEIIKLIRSTYNGVLSLMTNGTLINERNVKTIVHDFDIINLSLNGYNEETCSLIRGKGVFNKVIDAIKLLQHQGKIKICLSMVETKQNHGHREDFIKLCNDLGVDYIFRKYENIGRGKLNETMLKNDTTYEQHSECNKNNYVEKRKISPIVFSCKAAITEFLVDAKGGVFPCALLFDDEFNMGNILRIDNFKKYIEKRIFEESDGYINFCKFIPYNLQSCKKCKYNMICLNCVAQVRQHMINGSFETNCKMMKECLRQYVG